MSSHDFIRFLTERFVEYVDTPKEKRKTKKSQTWTSHWFGMIPFSLRMLRRK